MAELNLLTENLCSMSDAAKQIPGRPHISTMWRWANRGIKGQKLETIKIGGRTVTSTQALTRFLSRINEESSQC